MDLHRSKHFDLHTPLTSRSGCSKILKVYSLVLLFIELTVELICMIPKVNLGFEKRDLCFEINKFL